MTPPEPSKVERDVEIVRGFIRGSVKRDFAEAALARLTERLEAAERERDGERTRVRFLEQVVDIAEQRVEELGETLRDIATLRFSDRHADMRACQEIARAALREGDPVTGGTDLQRAYGGKVSTVTNLDKGSE